jgi:hypothetical protein
MSFVSFLTAMVAVWGCTEREPEWAGTVTDSAGVTIVANPAKGIWTDNDQWTVTEELKIGATEGDPAYEFGEIGQIAVDSRGRIFVLDIQAQHIQVYSPDGVYQKTLGAPGRGPGELEGAEGLVMGPGDTLLVHGRWAARTNRYAPDGSADGSFRMQMEKGFPIRYHATSSGTIAVQLRPPAAGRPSVENPRDVVVLMSLEGVLEDTVITFASGELFKPGSPSEIRMYYAEPAWTLTDDLRLWFGVTDEYRIGIYADGTLRRLITKPFTRRSVSDRDQEPLWAYLEEVWLSAGFTAEVMREMRHRVHFAGVFPAFWFEGLAAGPMGTMWVQHVQPASDLTADALDSWNPFEDMGAPDWDVFGADGRFLGVVSLPGRFTPRVFRGDRIYGLWRDELDVQYVVRLRVLWPGAN